MRINWKVAGKAGEGIAVTGAMFAKLCARHGLNVFHYGEYPSLIRGGHNTAQISASIEPLSCHFRVLSLLVALNEESVALHLAECDEQTLIMMDLESIQLDQTKYPDLNGRFVSIPLVRLARETTGGSLASNVVAIGASCWMLGLSLDVFSTVIRDVFLGKGEEVVNKNLAAAKAGYEFAQSQGVPAKPAIEPKPKELLVMTGNEAVGLGALSAGVQFYASYPMTPTSALLHFMAEQQERYSLVVKHAEDEISAINQAIGASFAGVRAMTATSGGGFALMVEGVSLAGVTEVPLVVLEGQRPGPATGLPTWTGQADLQFVLRAGHGEFPRVVFTPGDADECFNLTRLAFELAEKYHTQVYLIGDKYLLESGMSVTKFPGHHQNVRFSMVDPSTLPADGSYKRFEVTEIGYSPRSVPGMPHGLQLTNSYEHDEHGYATEDAEMTKAMVDKRQRKLNGLQQEVPGVVIIGSSNADVTLVGWGSTKLVLMETVRAATALNRSVNAIHLPTMLPFPVESFERAAASAKKLIMVEGNSTGQAEGWIREHTGLQMHEHIRRYDGRPFYSEDLLSWLEKHVWA